MKSNTKKNNSLKIEILKKYLYKFLYIIEFLVAIFCAYSLYQIVLNRNNLHIWSLKYLIIFVPTIIMLIGCIILNYKKNKEKIEKIIISFLIPVGMLYVFFMAPSYVPDEQAHILKSYEISTGELITPIKEDGSSKTKIPKFFVDNMIPNISKYGQFNLASMENTDYNEIVEEENEAQAYPAILYIFSSIGFLIGRLFEINGIFTIYLARLFNFAVFLIMGYYSMKIIPFGKFIIGTILFLPMSFQQGASVSADCILNAVSIMYIAYTLYLINKNDQIKWFEKVIYIAMSIIIGISKIAYVPMIGLSLLFIGAKNITKKQKIIFIITTILITIICSIAWFMFMQRYQNTLSHSQYLQENNVNMSEQIRTIIENPRNIIEIIKNTIKDGAYIVGAIGNQLGWLNIETSNIVIIMFIAILAISSFLTNEKEELRNIEKIWMIFIMFGVYVLVILALYLIWTSVGLDEVLGVQGRYFIPILPLLLLCLCKKDRYIKFKNVNLMLPIILTILNVIAISDIIEFFI